MYVYMCVYIYDARIDPQTVIEHHKHQTTTTTTSHGHDHQDHQHHQDHHDETTTTSTTTTTTANVLAGGRTTPLISFPGLGPTNPVHIIGHERRACTNSACIQCKNPYRCFGESKKTE